MQIPRKRKHEDIVCQQAFRKHSTMARNCETPVYVDGLGGSEASEANPDMLLFPNVPHDPTAMLPRKRRTALVPLTATDSPLPNEHQMDSVVWGAEAAATSGKYMFGQRPEHWSRRFGFPAEHEVLLEENTWLSMLGM
jgi:hypothetical protein